MSPGYQHSCVFCGDDLTSVLENYEHFFTQYPEGRPWSHLILYST